MRMSMLYLVEMNMVGKGHMTLDCEGHMTVRVRILVLTHSIWARLRKMPKISRPVKRWYMGYGHPYIGRSRSFKKMADDML